MKPRHALLLIVAGYLAGCDSATGTSCADAIDAVRDCYGQQAADEFAATCTDDRAAQVGDDACSAKSDDRADDDFLCEVIGLCKGPREFEDEVENFKYGSIGTDLKGLPYWMFRTLPQICPDRMPLRADGSRSTSYESFGLVYEPDHDLPIGFSRRVQLGLELVNINCAACHTATVRSSPGATPQTVLGAPGQFDVGAYQQFVVDCLRDPRFTVGNVLDVIQQQVDLGLKEKAFYAAAIKVAAKAAGDRGDLIDFFFSGRPAWGPGRSDPVNSVRALMFDTKDFDAIGVVDNPSIWDQGLRAGRGLHWDGGVTSLLERNVGVVLATGVDPDDIPLDRLERVDAWLTGLPAPAFPFAVDQPAAAQGKLVFDRECADCHGDGGSRQFAVIAVADVGTEPGRHESQDQAWVDQLTAIRGRDWSFSTVRATDGYLASPLDGIWMRAPYLHNGSVPSLRDLLEPPTARPATFHRGSDVYDPAVLGFQSTSPTSGERPGFAYDTAQRGNSNQGHVYGTDLPGPEKQALLEYLKTL